MGAGASTAVAEPTYRDASHMSVPTFEETRDHVLRSMEVERAAASPPGVHVVIDGMNVALGNVPSYETDASAIRAAELRGLQLAVEYWATAGVGFKIFAPRGWIDDHPEVAELQRASLLFATPGGRDDHFLIQHADVHGSFVVSNDRFLDHVRDRGYDGRWLDYHRVPFMFDPSFAPDPDALLRMRAFHDGTAPDFALATRARARAPPAAAAAAPPPRARAPAAPTADVAPGPRTAQALALFEARDETCLALVSEVAAVAAPGALTTLVGDDTERLVVPRQAVGRVIGKRGATIQGIERNSGARVRVDDGGDRSSDIAGILIAGAPDQRAQAVEAITDIVSRSRYPPPRKDAMDLC